MDVGIIKTYFFRGPRGPGGGAGAPGGGPREPRGGPREAGPFGPLGPWGPAFWLFFSPAETTPRKL